MLVEPPRPRWWIWLKIEVVRIEQLAGVADALGARSQAFGSKPYADGLFRHL